MLINDTLFRILHFPNLYILNPLTFYSPQGTTRPHHTSVSLCGQQTCIYSKGIFFFCLITFSSKNSCCACSFTLDLCSNILSDSSWHQFSIKPSYSSHLFPWIFSSKKFSLPSLYGFYVFSSLPALNIKKWGCFINFTLLWTFNCS